MGRKECLYTMFELKATRHGRLVKERKDVVHEALKAETIAGIGVANHTRVGLSGAARL